MRGVVLVLVLLLAVPAVFAIHIQTKQAQMECRTRLDCVQMARTTQVLCAPGFAPTPEPECSNGKCQLCRQPSNRITVDCRIDTDCATKRTCGRPLVAQCTGSKCVCGNARPECVRDRDCIRPGFLQQRYQRMSCYRGKCVNPQALITMLPRFATQGVPQ